MIETLVGNIMINNIMLAVITIAIVLNTYVLIKSFKYLKRCSADLFGIYLLNKEAHGLFSDIVSKQRNHCDKQNHRRYSRKPKDVESHPETTESEKEVEK